MMDSLVATGVACRRGERILFTDFDLSLAAGELVWLRAVNGYGKTTLLRVLAGLARPDSGTVARNLATLYLAHANALKEDLTVIESLRFATRLAGLPVDDTALVAAIAAFGMERRRHAPIRTLSQGQRRRVALMRLCVSPPGALWLLDEPYDALDSDATAVVDRLLLAHAAGGGAAILTSHVAPALDADRLRTVQLDTAAVAT